MNAHIAIHFCNEKLRFPVETPEPNYQGYTIILFCLLYILFKKLSNI